MAEKIVRYWNGKGAGLILFDIERTVSGSRSDRIAGSCCAWGHVNMCIVHLYDTEIVGGRVGGIGDFEWLGGWIRGRQGRYAICECGRVEI